MTHSYDWGLREYMYLCTPCMKETGWFAHNEEKEET